MFVSCGEDSDAILTRRLCGSLVGTRCVPFLSSCDVSSNITFRRCLLRRLSSSTIFLFVGAPGCSVDGFAVRRLGTTGGLRLKMVRVCAGKTGRCGRTRFTRIFGLSKGVSCGGRYSSGAVQDVLSFVRGVETGLFRFGFGTVVSRVGVGGGSGSLYISSGEVYCANPGNTYCCPVLRGPVSSSFRGTRSGVDGRGGAGGCLMFGKLRYEGSVGRRVL